MRTNDREQNKQQELSIEVYMMIINDNMLSHTLECPFMAASCKGVSSSNPVALTDAPACTRAKATSYHP